MYWLCYTTAQILGKLKCAADPINQCSIKRASIFKYCKNGQTAECLFLHLYVASQVHTQDESKRCKPKISKGGPQGLVSSIF